MNSRTPSSPSSIRDRSRIVRCLRWLSTWHGIRRVLIVLAWTVTIVALLYGLEYWRARRAWDQYRRQLEARGEQLNYKAYIPKPVPDDQNFAATPFVKSWFAKTNAAENEQWYSRDPYARIGERLSSSWISKKDGERHFIDLVACAQAFAAIRAGTYDPQRDFESHRLDLGSRASAAPEVLKGLSDDEAYFAELRDASRRPYARYPVDYNLDNPWAIQLPHLRNVRALCRRLQLRACAELAMGASDKALADVKLTLYLADSLKSDPFLISYLVRIACLSNAAQPVWEGLAEHAWSEPQLEQLQTLLSHYDFVADLKRPLGAEQAAGILTIELIRKKGPFYLNDLTGSTESEAPSGHGIGRLVGLLIPHGWYYREELNYSRLFHTLLGPDLDLTTTRISPEQVEARSREFDQQMRPPGLGRVIHHQLLAGLLLPALNRVPLRAAAAQTTADETMLACALERYRLANGQFPDNLKALVPKFVSDLPNDLLTGEPYKYHRKDDGSFVLYSVGWNAKDDGGAHGKSLFDEKEGDWVWEYPGR